jgi:polyphosphate kinase
MGANLRDQALSWRLDAEGEYVRESNDPDAFSAHTYFMTNPSLSGRGSAVDRTRAGPRLVTEKTET